MQDDERRRRRREVRDERQEEECCLYLAGEGPVWRLAVGDAMRQGVAAMDWVAVGRWNFFFFFFRWAPVVTGQECKHGARAIGRGREKKKMEEKMTGDQARSGTGFEADEISFLVRLYY